MKNDRSALHLLGKLSIAGLSAVFLLSACDSTSKMTDAEHFSRAREMHAGGNDKAAMVEVRNALQKNPKNVDARVLLADIYLARGSGKQAQTELEIAVQRGANAARLKLPFARAYLLQSNFDQAALQAKVTLVTPPDDRAALMEVEAKARVGMRQYDAACKLFDDSRAADPKFVKAYWGSATCAAGKGNSEQARAIVGQALTIDPNDSGSWVLLGDIDRLDRKFDAAEKSYGKAIELKKNNVDALLGRALVYAESNRLPQAEADLKTLSTVYRGHPLAGYITGIIRFRQGRYAEAKTAFETTLTTAPEHFPSILWLGLTNYVQGNYEVAATQLNQYIALVPNAPKVRALLALTRARIGGVQQAEIDLGELGKLKIDDPQTLALIGETHTFLGNPTAGSQFLARAVELSPDASDTRVTLAASLLEKNDVAGAIAQLQSVLAQKPDYVPATAMLIQALVKKKDYAAAMREARAFEQKDPNNPIAGNYIGSIDILMGDEKAARAAFEKVVENHPAFFPASNNLALLAIKNKDLDRAASIYRGMLKTDPNSLAALLGLHNVERVQGHADEADKALARAVQSHPNDVLPAQMMAQIYLSSGRPRKALEATEVATRTHPNDAGLLEVRGLAYLALNEPASAIIPFNKLVQLRGDSPDAYVYLSAAQTALGDKPAAKAALNTALKLNPAHYGARLVAGRFALVDGRTDEAMTIAKALERDKPGDPSGFVLEASALNEAKKPRDALRVLKAVSLRFPKSNDVRLALVKTLAATGDSAGMFDSLQEWRRVDPDNSLAAAALAEAYLRAGKDSEAVAEYQAQLKLQPDNVRALNNVAFLLMTRAPQEATEYAQRATRLEPNNANALDTLGQIQTGRGEFKDAIATYRRANQLAPRNPQIRYHLAVALAQSGEKQLARRELERLLASSPNFEGEADARALLSQLPKI